LLFQIGRNLSLGADAAYVVAARATLEDLAVEGALVVGDRVESRAAEGESAGEADASGAVARDARSGKGGEPLRAPEVGPS